MRGLRLKKGDIVIVRKGKDKGKTGRVLMIYPEKNRVMVEKINFVKAFIRPDRSKNVQGGHHGKGSPPLGGQRDDLLFGMRTGRAHPEQGAR